MNTKINSFIGILVILFVAYLFSANKKSIKWRKVILGVLLQFAFAILILGIPSLQIPGVFRFVFDFLNAFVTNMVDFTNAGTQFLFGPLAQVKEPWGFIFAFRALPTIIFFSGVMSGLYYLGILQKIVKFFAIIMQKTLGTSGAETLSGAANIFIGQTEAPLLVKPYVPRMTQSEIFCVMVGGMATIAAGVEGAYVGLLKARLPDIAGHLLTASVLGAIGGLVISKMIMPEMAVPETQGKMNLNTEDKIDVNVIESISRGASDGIMLALNVAAMLIVFISLIAIFDGGLKVVSEWLSLSETMTFAKLIGHLAQPIAWLLGVPWAESQNIGQLIGEKVVMNEFVGYVHLAELGPQLSDRSLLIASYALCGFANISSIGIQIGGIGGLAGQNKKTIARLGLLAVLGGNLACFLSACIAGILY